MNSPLPLVLRSIVLLTVASFTLLSIAWSAPKYKVLHAFVNRSQGWAPYVGVVLDGRGNLYGAAAVGGAYGWGAIYELTPTSNGKWSETVLYSFCPGGWPCNDGDDPDGNIILDKAGNLYSATAEGGTGVPAAGTVFELSPGSDGWTHTVLYSFCSRHDCPDGSGPGGNMTMDQHRNLYGAAGYAFELSPDSDGWTERVLHRFCPGCKGGSGPAAGVIMDLAGNLFGTTGTGGGGTKCSAYGCGTAYELSRTSGGRWKEQVLHSFGSFTGDGIFPGVGALAFGASGSVYGTTVIGGATGNGTVFKLTPDGNGHWKETIVYSFKSGGSGDRPAAGVVVDKAGNLYGTTASGGDAQCDCGVVYKLAPAAHGKWRYTVMHRFTGPDGAEPDANLIFDAKGNLYGTTVFGAAPGEGVVFEITP